MKRLFLLRHAKAGPGPKDHSRPLAPRGNRDSFWLGQYIKKLPVLPDFVLCSSARRTTETLDRLQAGAALIFPARFRDDLYLASAQYIFHQIRAFGADITAPLIIGHNPGLARLFQDLTRDPPRDDRSLKFPTGTVAIMDFDIESWSALKSSTGQLLEMVIASDRIRSSQCRKKN